MMGINMRWISFEIICKANIDLWGEHDHPLWNTVSFLHFLKHCKSFYHSAKIHNRGAAIIGILSSSNLSDLENLVSGSLSNYRTKS